MQKIRINALLVVYALMCSVLCDAFIMYTFILFLFITIKKIVILTLSIHS